MIALAGACFTLLAAWLNPGFIGIDDYRHFNATFLPVGAHSVGEIVAQAEFRSPTPNLVLFALGHVAHYLGATSPLGQYTFLRLLVGLLCFFACFLAITGHFKGQALRQKTAALLAAFYCVCPLFYSRVMIESLSLPFVSLSALYAHRYWQTERTRSLVYALLLISIGSAFRYQVGICAFALVTLALFRKDWGALGALAVFGLLAFVVTGWIDLGLRGSFHYSLVAYLKYNYLYAAALHGSQAFYVFIALFIAMTLPPTLFSRFKGFQWKPTYSSLIPALLFFCFFLVAHTLSAHKEERFMVPILSVFLVLLVPLLAWLYENRKYGRLIYFGLLNTVVLFGASFSVAQNNTLGVMLFLDKYPSFSTVYDVDHSMYLFQKALVNRPIKRVEVAAESLPNQIPCDAVVVIRESWEPRIEEKLDAYTRIKVCRPGWIEAMAIKLNPIANSRRQSISLFRSSHCLGG